MIRMVLCGGKCGERGILSTKMVESLPLRQTLCSAQLTGLFLLFKKEQVNLRGHKPDIPVCALTGSQLLLYPFCQKLF